jgi:hypothetical protein
LRILRYWHSTVVYVLVYIYIEYFGLIGYTYSYWVGFMDDRKSTSVYSFSMGLVAVAWSIKKKPTVSLSITEAKYKSTITTSCEAVWLRIILVDLHEQQEQPTQLICGNQSPIQMTKNPVFHKKTKHIDIQYHFV